MLTRMRPKEAARAAKKYVVELFRDEDIKDVGLEELDFEDESNTWKITVGFARPWDERARQKSLHDELRAVPFYRSYKVVRVSDEDGRVTSVKDLVLPAVP